MKMPCHISDERVYNPWDEPDMQDSEKQIFNFDELPQERKDALVLAYFNAMYENQFRAGGMCIPEFKSLQEMNDFFKILNEFELVGPTRYKRKTK